MIIANEEFWNTYKHFDKEIVLEIIDTFMEDYPVKLINLDKEIENEDYKKIKIEAHSLKGMFANFYASKIVNQLKEVEKESINNNLNKIKILVLELKSNISDFLEELKKIRETLVK